MPTSPDPDYRALLENLPLGVFVADSKGRALFVNERFRSLTGASAGALSGEEWLTRVPPVDRERVIKEWEDATGAGRDFQVETQVALPEGELLTVECRATPIVDRDRLFGYIGVVVDVTHRHRLEKERQGFFALVENSSDFIGIADVTGRPQYVNPAGRRMVGLRVPVEQTKILDYYAEHIRDFVERVTVPTMLKEGHWAGETTFRHFETGESIPVSDSQFLIHDPGSGRVLGWGTITRDITQQKRAEEAMRESDRQKDEFLAMLAHELRNPIAALTNGLELLGRGTDGGGEESRYLAIFRRQLGSLERIVDDLLDVSRVTRGAMSMRREAVDVVAALRNAVHVNRTAIERRGHELVTRFGPGPFIVTGDGTRLEQIFANLLANAVKFTPSKGHIWIGVERGVRGGDDVVRVSFQDDGEGIPEAMRAAIFEPFVQCDKSLHRAEGGLGVGLTLAKRLTQMHGGEIEVESPGLGGGSTFTVELPLVATSRFAMPESQSVPIKSTSKSVVVVEDNADARDMLKELLESFGHRVEVAGDGPSGTELIARVRPDVAILDVGLPGMDGYELARRVRARPELADVRLVAVTGYGDDVSRKRAREAGFNVHLTKPASGADLIAALS